MPNLALQAFKDISKYGFVEKNKTNLFDRLCYTLRRPLTRLQNSDRKWNFKRHQRHSESNLTKLNYWISLRCKFIYFPNFFWVKEKVMNWVKNKVKIGGNFIKLTTSCLRSHIHTHKYSTCLIKNSSSYLSKAFQK